MSPFLKAAYALMDIAAEANLPGQEKLSVILSDPDDGRMLMQSMRPEFMVSSVEIGDSSIVELFKGELHRFADIRGVRFYWPVKRYAVPDSRKVVFA